MRAILQLLAARVAEREALVRGARYVPVTANAPRFGQECDVMLRVVRVARAAGIVSWPAVVSTGGAYSNQGNQHNNHNDHHMSLHY